MTNEALNSAQVREVEHISEIEVRKYFDYYLKEIVPVQQRAERERSHLLIEKHDADDKAHGGVEGKFSRFVWTLLGVSTAGGLGGGALAKLLASVLGVG